MLWRREGEGWGGYGGEGVGGDQVDLVCDVSSSSCVPSSSSPYLSFSTSQKTHLIQRAIPMTGSHTAFYEVLYRAVDILVIFEQCSMF